LFSPDLHAFEVPLGWPCFDHATLSHGWRRMSLYNASFSRSWGLGASDGGVRRQGGGTHSCLSAPSSRLHHVRDGLRIAALL
jgi:hypothetical protein